MKVRIFVIFALLLLLVPMSGCSSAVTDILPGEEEEANQPPNAYIDLISPTEAAPGESISFEGHGTDTDGTVVAYRWVSNIDGPLSVAASFDTTELSEGNHIISFKVQDNNDTWSEEVEDEVTVIAPEEEEEPEELAIIYFEADPESIISGFSSTLSWSTTGATEVSIDQGIGEVDAEGTYDVSQSGDQIKTYTLTASNAVDTVTATVDVESHLMMVMPDEYEVTLSAVVNDSGYVRSNGQVTNKYIYVGDDGNDIPFQGFFSFDISELPEDAMINSVVLDLSDHEAHNPSIYGDPFDDLGCLRVYIDDYGTLDGSDYTLLLFYKALPVASYCSWGELVPEEYESLEDALENRIGNDKFQFRLQFVTHTTDNNGDQDIVRWTSSHLPKITINYYSYTGPI